MSRRVEFSPEALGDLLDLYGYVAQRDGNSRAIGYIRRIEKTCHSLSIFPERGKRRDDIRPGLRVLGFERSAAIAISISTDSVTILRVLYGGQNLEASLADPGSSC